MAGIEYTVQALRNGIESADATIAEFQKRLAENPVHAFQWADAPMKAAARKYWFSHYVDAIEGAQPENRNVENVRKFVTQEIMRRAASRSVSSSRCSNAVSDFELEVLTEILDKIVG